MKSVTEFAIFALNNGMQAKAALTAEGKTPEEIAAALGTTFKFEGDKLKHFMNALEVASQNLEGLSRVLVVALNEGESAPAKAVKMDESHYVPEFKKEARPIVMQKTDPKGGGKKGGGKNEGRPKTSPWGLTPEEKAAKNKGAAGKAPKPS